MPPKSNSASSVTEKRYNDINEQLIEIKEAHLKFSEGVTKELADLKSTLDIIKDALEKLNSSEDSNNIYSYVSAGKNMNYIDPPSCLNNNGKLIRQPIK